MVHGRAVEDLRSREVRGRSGRGALPGDGGLDESEVDQLGSIVVDHHIGRLDVKVQQSASMEVSESSRQLQKQRGQLSSGCLAAFAAQRLADHRQIVARDVLHGEVRPARGRDASEVDRTCERRMAELAQRPELGEDAFGDDVLPVDLQSDDLVVVESVTCQVHVPGSAVAETAFDVESRVTRKS